MATLLRTPGLERWIGRNTALLTVTGRRSGRTYTTPVSHARDGDTVLVIGHVSRTWWRNLADRPDVRIRLAGIDHRGRARVLADADAPAVGLLRSYMRQQPMAARAQGIVPDDHGPLRTDDLRRVLRDTVVVAITLTDEHANAG